MAKYHLFVLLIQLLNFSPAWSICIPLYQCDVAAKYIRTRPNDPETRRYLQNAHCGWIQNGTSSRVGVHCDRIPDFKYIPGCVYVSACPEAMQLINTRRRDAEAIELLRSSACGYNGRKNMIMCKNIASKSAATNKIDLLPKHNECGGLSPRSKIYVGQVAELEDFPWLALFKYKAPNGDIKYRCHGSLISHRYVVTAAHCLSYSSAVKNKYGSLHTIVLGEYNISESRDCIFEEYGGPCADPVQEFSPESIHIHPKYGSENAVTDIALIRLNASVLFSEFVRPICLPIDPLLLKSNEVLWISGWGYTEKREMSTVKLKARIYYIIKADCVEYEVDDTQICAGSNNGADTCQGDSGGPLMVHRRFDDDEDRFVLAGVVSYGNICGSGSAIYTNVSPFVEWILQTMRA